jgi:hypothetical protein
MAHQSHSLRSSYREILLEHLFSGEVMRRVGPNVGDVTTKSGKVAWRVDLPKAITKVRRVGVAFLSKPVRAVL